MRGGDISNEVTPRLLFVYEDVLAKQVRTPVAPRRFMKRRANWHLLISTYEVDQLLAARLWMVVGRLGVRFDAVTFLPAEAVPHIREHLESENIPVAHVRSYDSPQALADALAYMPDVIGVYDLPARAVAYGGKGQDIGQLDRLLG